MYVSPPTGSTVPTDEHPVSNRHASKISFFIFLPPFSWGFNGSKDHLTAFWSDASFLLELIAYSILGTLPHASGCAFMYFSIRTASRIAACYTMSHA
jgi:hypothetical protein